VGDRDWARYSEVHGNPIRKGKVPLPGRAEAHKEEFSTTWRTSA
jgi:hypothetical protein